MGSRNAHGGIWGIFVVGVGVICWLAMSEPRRGESNGGAYQLKNEPCEGILTLLSGLAELTSKLEMLDSEKEEMKEVCYVM